MKTRLIVLVLSLMLAACTGSDPDRKSLIVGRVTEALARDSGEWAPIGRDAVQVSDGTAVVVSGTDGTLARFRLTILDSGLSALTFDVLVSAECYDLVGVGEVWPTPLPECR